MQIYDAVQDTLSNCWQLKISHKIFANKNIKFYRVESFCVLYQYNLHALVLNANCPRNPENCGNKSIGPKYVEDRHFILL